MTKKDQKLDHHLWHKKGALSRRDLFAAGFYSVGGSVMVPSIFSTLAGVARGATQEAACNAATTTAGIPVIVIDLAGGANIAGANVIVGGRGGQRDFLPGAAYETICVSAARAPGQTGVVLQDEFGLLFHPDSPMLAGLRAAVPVPARAQINGLVFCAKSNDDNSNNPHNPVHWVVKGGSVGRLVPIVGNRKTVSGGNSVAPRPSVNAANLPVSIASRNDVLGLVDVDINRIVGTLSGANGALTKQDAERILNAVKTVSQSTLESFQGESLNAQFKTLVDCGYINAARYIRDFSPEALDPTGDAMVTAVFGDVSQNQELQAQASIAKLVLDGYAGAGTISLGGYDYHVNNRTNQNTLDQNAGLLAGRILALAAQKGKSVVVYMVTDGAVGSSAAANQVGGLLAATSDSGERGATMMLVYRAGTQGRPVWIDQRQQIGAFNSRGAVDLAASPVADNVDALAKAFMTNYLALSGREGDFGKVVGDVNFDTKKVLACTKIT